MKNEVKHALFLLGLILYGLFFTGMFRFDVLYSAYTDNFTMYHMSVFRDLALFPRDAVAGILRQNMNHPFVREFFFVSFYRALLTLMPLAAAIKLAAFLLASLSAFFVCRIGRALYADAEKALFLTTAFLVCFFSTNVFYYGQNRSFGVLLFVLLVYALVAKRYLLAPPLIYAFYVLYPYLALSAGLVGLALLPKLGTEDGFRVKYLLLLLLSVSLCALTDIRLDAAMDQFSAWQYKFIGLWGEALSASDPRHMLLYFVLNLNEYCRLHVLVLALFSAALLAGSFYRGWAFLSPLRGSGLAPLSLFPLAFAALYSSNPLYASRQLVYALPFVLTLLFCGNVLFLLPGRRPRTLALVLAALFAVAHPFYNWVSDVSVYKGLYSFVSGLPKDALIAAEPDSQPASGLSFYSGRAVFYNYIMVDSFSLATPELDRRKITKDLLAVMCAEDPGAAARFAAENGIDYFLVESSLYGPGGACEGRNSALYASARSGAYLFKTDAGRGGIYLVAARAAGLKSRRPAAPGSRSPRPVLQSGPH